MSLYGFSRKDIAQHLSEFAKKDLIANYPNAESSAPGLSEFKDGAQSAIDPELYMFIAEDGIPAAEKVAADGDDVKVECTKAMCKIYKPRMRSQSDWANLDKDVDVNRLRTFRDGTPQGGASQYGTASYYVYNTHTESIPANTMSLCALVGGVLFAFPPQGGGAKEKRIKFRLKEGFNDRGAPVTAGINAQAYVLDQWGCDGLALNTIVEVCDPRKCFAHAIGSDDLTGIQGIDPFLPAGGSIGYAVMTYDIDTSTTCDNCGTPTSDCEPANCYPRWEVEQCTQVINKMRVTISRAQTGDVPTGELGEFKKTLVVNPSESVVSQWPYVDYPPELVPPEGSRTYWSIEATNPHRFSAGDGWAIIERVRPNSRAEDAENVCVPYSPNTPPEDIEWQIVEVQNPIARWICAQYVNVAQSPGEEPDMRWQFSQSFQEGEHPLNVNYFPSGDALNAQVRTHPCLTIDCLDIDEPGVAFWDPNTQYYNVISTNSSLYGTAKQVEVVGQVDTGTTQDPLIKFGESSAGEDPCDLVYKKLEPIRVFGGNQLCPAVATDETADANLQPVSVVTGYTINPADPTAVCLNSTVIYVCASEPGPDLPCFDVCDPCDPTGCCEYPPGTYTDGVTQSDCDAQGGTWTAGDCPQEVCIECDLCTEPGIRFTNFALSWSGVQTGNGIYDGRAQLSTVSWAVDTNCCAQLTVTLESDDPAINPQQVTATVCLNMASGNCPNAMFELNITWSQTTYAGATLPTTLCGGFSSGCAGDYGKYGGSGLYPSLPSVGGTWDEADISVASCTP